MQIAHLPYITIPIFILFVSSDRLLDKLTSLQINAFKVTHSPWASLIHTHWHKKIISRRQEESISMAFHHANGQWTNQPLLSLTSNK